MSNQNTSDGRFANPGKHYYLELTNSVVDETNEMLTENGLSSTQKSKIICGMIPDVDDLWRREQLSDELKAIVEEYSAYLEEMKFLSINFDAAGKPNFL